MDFLKYKIGLINKGNQLLGFVKKKNFGMEIIEDVMDDEHLKELNNWYQDVEEFSERYGLQCQRERIEANSWIINGEKVSVKRIKEIMSQLERINGI